MTEPLVNDALAASATPVDKPKKKRLPKSAAAPPAARKPPHPVLDQLAALHPQLFGARFVPLKRGIYEDLVARHAELPPEELKTALGLHARSTRYLECMAAGLARHDLDGQPTEPVSTEHRHHAILEVFRRRQRQATAAPGDRRPDPRERALQRLVDTIEASGLSQVDYRAQMRVSDEACATLLDDAFAEFGRRSARHEALRRAFATSGKSPAEFAEMYGLPLAEVRRLLGDAAPATPTAAS